MRLDPRLRIVCLFALTLGWVSGALSAQPLVPEMRFVPAGAFLMGTEGGAKWEGPVHRVQVDAFWISSRPVTLQAFQRYRANHINPEDQSPSASVLAVSWDDANGYCRWLSEQSGVEFRLATEAEWERAARGGLVQQRHPWGADAAVAEKQNPFGLYFWPGAPWEWVADWFADAYFADSPESNPAGPVEGKFRVLRGGGYPDQPEIPAVANRGSARPAMRSNRVSFRIVSASEPPQPTEPVQISKAPPVQPPTVSGKPAPKPVNVSAPVGARQPPPAPSGESVLTGVDLRDGATPVVRLRLSGSATCKGFPLREPDRYVVDCEGVTSAQGRAERKFDHALIQRVRWSQYKITPKVARAVIDMSGPARATVANVDGGVEVSLAP